MTTGVKRKDSKLAKYVSVESLENNYNIISSKFVLTWFGGSVCIFFGCLLFIGALIVGLVTLSLLFYQLNILDRYLSLQQDGIKIEKFNITEMPRNFKFTSSFNYTVQNKFEKEIYIRHGYIDVYYKNYLISNTKTTKEYHLLHGFQHANFTFNIDISKNNIENSVMKPMLKELNSTGKVELTFYGSVSIFFVYTGSKYIKPFTFLTPLK
eukprot:gene9601-1803_t